MILRFLVDSREIQEYYITTAIAKLAHVQYNSYDHSSCTKLRTEYSNEYQASSRQQNSAKATKKKITGLGTIGTWTVKWWTHEFALQKTVVP